MDLYGLAGLLEDQKYWLGPFQPQIIHRSSGVYRLLASLLQLLSFNTFQHTLPLFQL